jgi:hypothetical protein
MTSVKSRLARLEKEQRFKRWLEIQDLLERFTDGELKTFAETGELPEWVLCEDLADPPSRLDRLDRGTLLKLFDDDERLFGGRSDEEISFYATHGYWPQAAEEDTKL